VDATVNINNPLTVLSGITDSDKGARRPPPGKINVEAGLPLVDILIFSFL